MNDKELEKYLAESKISLKEEEKEWNELKDRNASNKEWKEFIIKQQKFIAKGILVMKKRIEYLEKEELK